MDRIFMAGVNDVGYKEKLQPLKSRMLKGESPESNAKLGRERMRFKEL